MSPEEFEQLVADAITIIPDEFRSYLDNVHIEVQEEPSATVRQELGLGPDETLFGLYTGTPLTERCADFSGLPDRIMIFRGPLLDEFDDARDIRREVARTIIHETAHHFGIKEERLVELGWD